MDVINAKVDTQGCGLGEDVAELRFELGVKISAAEAELVLVVVSDLSVDIKKQLDQEKEK